MKKLITLFAVILLSATVVHSQSVTYLVHNGTGATWTITEIEGTEIFPIDLSKINNGSAASLDAWFNDRSLESPTMGEDAFQFAAGDKVWIIKGTYVLTDSIILFPGVSVYGGFAGSENAISGRAKGDNPWDFTNETILDGNATTMCIFGSSASAPTIVDGLTISKGKSASTVSGAGATLNGSQMVMQNCIIKNCVSEATTYTASAGIVLTEAATIKDSYIHDNQTAGSGAGVTVYGDACTISGCKIANNTSNLFGGGIFLYAQSSGVSVLNCEISGNTTNSKSGGGLALFNNVADNAEPTTISNCTFTDNKAASADGSGGAMNLNTKATNIVNITNCTFTGNTSSAGKSTTKGGGAICFQWGIHNIDKCTFTNNVATLTNGGAVMVTTGPPNAQVTISNSVFTGNTSGNHASALMFTASATMNNCLVYKNKGGNSVYVGSTANVLGTFNNCTFASNTTNAESPAPNGIYLSTPSAPNAGFKNCLFYNSGAKPIAVDPSGEQVFPPSVEYCGFDKDLSGTWTDPSNIFTITAASFFNADGDDYHLATGSPAIDKGTHIEGCDPDLGGFVRTAPFDMGAYEYNSGYTPPSSVDKVEYPFNCYAYGNSIIVKGLEQEEVNIYSITGVRVFSKQVTGSMSIDLPAGIYIVNIANFNKKVIVR
ncbi:MAG: T9SS type A sorting domain-containing protein [Pigmentiphaga sp.]|nr:T9SS type A sorting domain-containing protein [Pigmentiphaga sp.]